MQKLFVLAAFLAVSAAAFAPMPMAGSRISASRVVDAAPLAPLAPLAPKAAVARADMAQIQMNEVLYEMCASPLHEPSCLPASIARARAPLRCEEGRRGGVGAAG